MGEEFVCAAVCWCVCAPFEVIFYAHVSLISLSLCGDSHRKESFLQLRNIFYHLYSRATKNKRQHNNDRRHIVRRVGLNVQSSPSQIGKFINYCHIVCRLGWKTTRGSMGRGCSTSARQKNLFSLSARAPAFPLCFIPCSGKEMKSDRKRATAFSL
jgi:hypothetical protein